MSGAAKGFAKFIAMLLVPPVLVAGFGYTQQGWPGAIYGGILGLLAGLWSVWNVWQRMNARRRIKP